MYPDQITREQLSLNKIVSSDFSHLVKQILVETIQTNSIDAAQLISFANPKHDWRRPIIECLLEGKTPHDHKQSWKVIIKVTSFVMQNGTLNKRGYLAPHLRCVNVVDAQYVK